MQERLLILHENAFELTNEQFESLQSEIYALSDELYNYVNESKVDVEKWNEYSELFAKNSFLTVFSCENVEVNIELWRKLVKEKNVALLSDTLNRDVNEIYSILIAYQDDEFDECDDENCDCHEHHHNNHECDDENCDCHHHHLN